MKRAESDLVKVCLTFLKLKGILAWRNNAGRVRVGKAFLRLAPEGSPDIVGVMPAFKVGDYGGRFLGVECKLEGRKLTDAQTEFLVRIDKLGGLALVVHSVQELEEFLQ